MNRQRHPKGKIHPDDEGEIEVRIGVDRRQKRVVLDFGKKVAWIGFDAQSLRAFARNLLEKADEIDPPPPAPGTLTSFLGRPAGEPP